MTKQNVLACEAAHRLIKEKHDECDHIWSAHRQCQWCHRMQKDVDAEIVALAYLALINVVEKVKL